MIRIITICILLARYSYACMSTAEKHADDIIYTRKANLPNHNQKPTATRNLQTTPDEPIGIRHKHNHPKEEKNVLAKLPSQTQLPVTDSHLELLPTSTAMPESSYPTYSKETAEMPTNHPKEENMKNVLAKLKSQTQLSVTDSHLELLPTSTAMPESSYPTYSKETAEKPTNHPKEENLKSILAKLPSPTQLSVTDSHLELLPTSTAMPESLYPSYSKETTEKPTLQPTSYITIPDSVTSTFSSLAPEMNILHKELNNSTFIINNTTELLEEESLRSELTTTSVIETEASTSPEIDINLCHTCEVPNLSIIIGSDNETTIFYSPYVSERTFSKEGCAQTMTYCNVPHGLDIWPHNYMQFYPAAPLYEAKNGGGLASEVSCSRDGHWKVGNKKVESVHCYYLRI